MFIFMGKVRILFYFRFFYNIVLQTLQKKRGRRRSKNTTHSTVTSRDAVVESTTNDIVYNVPSSDMVEPPAVLKQIKKRSISIEPVHSAVPEVIPAASPDAASDAIHDATPSANGTYMNHVMDEKIVDIDNNNEKLIDHGHQEGLLFHSTFQCLKIIQIHYSDTFSQILNAVQLNFTILT